MKKTSIFFGAAFMMLAAIGAYASSTRVLIPVFYESTPGGTCLSGFADTTCDITGTPDCVEPIKNSSGVNIGINRQIFATIDQTTLKCDDAYDRP